MQEIGPRYGFKWQRKDIRGGRIDWAALAAGWERDQQLGPQIQNLRLLCTTAACKCEPPATLVKQSQVKGHMTQLCHLNSSFNTKG